MLISWRKVPIAGIHKVVGACINILFFRVNFFSSGKTIDVLHQVQDQQLATIPYDLINWVNCRDLVSKFTDWAYCTRITSIVQYQKIDESKAIPYGSAECAVSVFSPRDDATDTSVFLLPFSLAQADPTVLQFQYF
jgi:hypothetical protein